MAELILQKIKKIYPKPKGIHWGSINLKGRKGIGGLHQTKREDVIALQHVNLEIERGEFVVLLGESGCGKTTLLRIIAGLEDIAEGRIWMEGEDITDVYPEDRDMAMIFQNYALYSHLTVYDNIAFPLQARHALREEIAESVSKIAELLELTDVLARKPGDLSGGQQQRVAIGRAVVRQPKICLMDEPFSNLDSNIRGKLRAYLKRLHRELGITFLYVTHDQAEAMMLGTKIVLMRDGMIQQVGTPQDLFLSPTNQFAASFIGQPQMNFLWHVPLRFFNGRWRITMLGKDIFLPEDRCTALQAERDNGRSVTLGIRPVHITPTEGGIPAVVEHADPLGVEVNLHLTVDGQNIVIVVPAPTTPYFRGQQICITPALDKIYLFDSETGIRVV